MRHVPLLLGPGPGRYGLPPTIGFIGHDFTKPANPAYSFHGRMSDNSEPLFASPLSNYYVTSCYYPIQFLLYITKQFIW